MTRYEIRARARGSPAQGWEDWFQEMEVVVAGTAGSRKTGLIFTGRLSDQSALLGILMQMHNLNLVIQSVQNLEEESD